MHNYSMGANAPGLAAPEWPTSDEPPAVAAAQGFRDQAKEDGADFAATVAAAEAAKAFSTLRAVLAMRGFALHIVSDGEGGTAYLVHKWSMSGAGT